jgi:hypothetical protein
LDNPMASTKDMITLLFMGILRSHRPTHNLAQNYGEGKHILKWHVGSVLLLYRHPESA